MLKSGCEQNLFLHFQGGGGAKGESKKFLHLNNTSQLKKVRRDIARVKTVMNQKDDKWTIKLNKL